MENSSQLPRVVGLEECIWDSSTGDRDHASMLISLGGN